LTKSIEYFLGAIHWLDALTPPLEGHLQKLAETVTALLQVDAAAQIRIDKPLDKTGAVVGAQRKKAVVGSPTRDIKRCSTQRKERHGLRTQKSRHRSHKWSYKADWFGRFVRWGGVVLAVTDRLIELVSHTVSLVTQL